MRHNYCWWKESLLAVSAQDKLLDKEDMLTLELITCIDWLWQKVVWTLESVNIWWVPDGDTDKCCEVTKLLRKISLVWSISWPQSCCGHTTVFSTEGGKNTEEVSWPLESAFPQPSHLCLNLPSWKWKCTQRLDYEV